MNLTEQEKQAAKAANKLGFFSHCIAAGMNEKQASTAYDAASNREARFEKIASIIRQLK